MTVKLITADHASLECSACHCTGRIDTMRRGMYPPNAIEPIWDSHPCEPCDGHGYREEVECEECASVFAPVGKRCGVEGDRLTCPECVRAIREEAA